MPSKNSINRPKQKIGLNRKIHKNAAKRNARERAGLLAPPRSNLHSMSGQIKSIPLELFKGTRLEKGTITTKTLSKKCAKKIERNLKYNQQRKILAQIQAGINLGMEIDIKSEPVNGESIDGQKGGDLQKVKASFWKALEGSRTRHLNLQVGNGTILGNKFF